MAKIQNIKLPKIKIKRPSFMKFSSAQLFFIIGELLIIVGVVAMFQIDPNIQIIGAIATGLGIIMVLFFFIFRDSLEQFLIKVSSRKRDKIAANANTTISS